MRVERDQLGVVEIADGLAYGAQTARAVLNFPISRSRLRDEPEFVRALAMVKQAAARANLELGVLAPEKAQVITAITDQIIAGQHHEHFVVDLIQGGAGTSSNMNANEVIANLGLREMGHGFGEYRYLHPNDDVNHSQSTNDVYPTAIRLALLHRARALTTTLEALAQAFRKKAAEFAGITKVGRTQLQDAVPMSLGSEFAAFAATLADSVRQITAASEGLRVINLGGTAIGDGILAPEGYRARAIAALSEISGFDLTGADDLFAAGYDQGALVQFSAALKSAALRMSKIASDLRLLSSGPRAGLGEIILPPVQAGSSIMPGKVNPVIPEMVNQVAYAVVGNDVTVTMEAEAGELQLNAMEPVLLCRLLESLSLMENAANTFRTRCVDGIVADADRCHALFEGSLALATRLSLDLGYDRTSALVYRARREGIGLIPALATEPGLPRDLVANLTGNIPRKSA